MNIGWPEILLILLVVLLLFGAKRLPDLARSLGKSLREFKMGREEGDELQHAKYDRLRKEQEAGKASDEKKPPSAPAA